MSTELSPDHGVAAMRGIGDFEAEEVPSKLTRLPRPDLTDDDPRSILERYRTKVLRVDALSALVAAAIAVVFRFGPTPSVLYMAITILIPVLWVGLVAIRHGYEYRFLSTGLEEYRRVASAGLLLFTVLAVASYTVQGDLSRLYVIVTAPGAVLLSLASRHAVRGWIYRLRVKGCGLQKVLVVGRADAAVTVIEKLDHEPQHGLVAVGACVPSSGHQPSHVNGVPVVGAPTQILQAVDEVQAQVVAVVSHPDLSGHALRRLAWALEERQVDLVVSPGIIEVAGPRLSIHPVAGLSLLHLERPAINGARMVAKEIFDKFLGGMFLLAAAPLLFTIAVAVKVTSRGPILFRQTRIGIDGREFIMLKFRSMVVDAEERRVELLESSEGNEMLFKMKRDPRVTRIGSIIRRFSLDELPQLWNVLRGDMSLVGPRPPLPEEVAGYSDDATRRLRVRPGLTGLWQVSGRSDLSWEESLRLDLRYVDNWSMALDMAILWRTGKAVVRGAGAY